jgi:uncharacterized surface protein with fasciclin (FAS1) repeats
MNAKTKMNGIVAAGLALALTAGVTGSAVAGQSAMKAKSEAKAEGNMPIYPLAQKAGFKTLTAAIQATKLQQTLTVDGPFTVFAPTDEAFAKLPEGVLDELLANPEALKNILLYHVVPGTVLAADVVGLTSATMANGEDVTVAVDNNGVKINQANVTQTDIMAKNGVIHVIDAVLLPPAAKTSEVGK